MALTPEQIAKINEKKNALPEAMRRDTNVDYFHGWFFVTLNTRGDVPILSTCEGNPAIADGEKGAPHCAYSELGEHVKECWRLISKFHTDVVVGECEVMPEHFHGLLFLPATNRRHLGHIIYGFMVGCSHAYWDTLGIDWRNMKDDSANEQQWQDKDHTMSHRGPALFVHGYNDMEPITEAEVEVKRAYIREQARKRIIQGDRHNCFRKYRQQQSRNWTVERCMQVISIDRAFRNNAAKSAIAQKNIKDRLITCKGDIGLDYIGHKDLLYSEKKLPLVCHSADAMLFEKQKETVLGAARKGWVIVSAFISPKERDIKKQLLIEQLPFIEIMDNGFSEKYKGVGKAFYALAECRLCQITPWNYLYQKEGSQVNREMCIVMNELAKVICNREDDWWKKN